MEQKIISKTAEQCIYLMKETNLDFYLIIPNNKQVSIVLGLFPNLTEEIVKTLPKEKDKAVILPVISDQILNSANFLEPTSYKYIDNVLSYLINTAYKMLTFNKLEVNQKILLNNHASYENFNKKYIEQYQGRVELYNLIPKPTPKPDMKEPIFAPPTEQKNEFKPVEPPFASTSNNNPPINKDEIEESIDPILYDEPVITSPDKKDNKEPGFVSYVLLGVLVAVISLVFLYLLL